MQRIAIERKHGMSPADFARDHLRDGGRPAIVTDALDAWPARTKWTFDFIKAAYGSDFVRVHFGLFSDVAKVTRIGEYIDHLDAPGTLPGLWVDDKDGKPLRTVPDTTDSPPYLMEWHAFQRHPELVADVRPAPAFVDDWTCALDDATRDMLQAAAAREFWSLYVGPRDSLSQLHKDFGHTHGCLAQLQGRKRAVLFSPADSAFLYGGRVDPEQPDLERFPLFDQATAHEGVLEPGELLFMPPDWWHHVRGLEKSITVSHNFFNASNVGPYLAHLLVRRRADRSGG